MSNSALLRTNILALVSAKIIALPQSQKTQLVTIANSSPRIALAYFRGRAKSFYMYWMEPE